MQTITKNARHATCRAFRCGPKANLRYFLTVVMRRYGLISR